jgi:hypothetical protein
MINKFYEFIGRRTVQGAKIKARQSLNGKSARIGALAVAGIAVIAIGAVAARSHAPAE